MGNDFILSLLPAITLIASFISTPSSTPVKQASSVASLVRSTLQAPVTSSQKEQRFYVVKNDDSLATIAKSEYGSAEYWTTLWNDNNWMKNPNLIEAGWKLKIRDKKPAKPEVLAKKLVKATQSAEPALVARETQSVAISAGPLNEAQITYLGSCESGMTPTRNSGNGYFGAFQFSPATWRSMGTGYVRADMAPLEIQKDAVQRLLSRSSIWTQFPGCARKMQLAGLL